MTCCETCESHQSALTLPSGSRDRPDIAFVGHAPHKAERGSGAFTGPPGKMLRQVLSEIGFDTSRIYYDNAVAYRPPGVKDNWKPSMTAMRGCNRRLITNLEEVRPKMVVGLGDGSTAVLGKQISVTRRRGLYQEVLLDGEDLPVFPTIHPESVIRGPDAFIDLYTDLERVKRILDGEQPVNPTPFENYFIVDTYDGFKQLISSLRRAGECVLDLETTALHPWEGEILSIGFSWQKGTAYVLDWQRVIKGDHKAARERKAMLKATLEEISCGYHNGQFDAYWLWENGIFATYDFDSMLANFALDERQGAHGLKRIAINRYWASDYDEDLKRLLDEQRVARGEDKAKGSGNKAGEDRKQPLILRLTDWEDDISRKAIMKYNGADADYTWRLREDLPPEMYEDEVKVVHDKLLIPAAKHFIGLERDGLLIDQPYWEDLGRKWEQELEEIEAKLKEWTGDLEINYGSNKQLAAFIYDDLGLDTMKARNGKTLTNNEVNRAIEGIDDDEAQEYWRAAPVTVYRGMSVRSTNTYMLYWLRQQHEFPRLMIQHRIVTQKYQTYYEAFKRIVRPDGRIGPRTRVHGTRTTRFSSTDPNIHGMPRLNEIKDIFRAEDGMVLIAADYSQAEIRMLAHLSGDANLTRICQETDIHSETAKTLFSKTQEELDAMGSQELAFVRRAAKTIGFGIIYGRGAASLAPQMGISTREAQQYIDQWFAGMPDAYKWIQRQKRKVTRDHEVVSMYGTKRRFPVTLGKGHLGHAEREGVNAPIQGPVSWMTLFANRDILMTLNNEGIETRTWPHIHDGFLFQVPEEYRDRGLQATVDRMHRVGFPTKVHFATEVKVGYSWGSMAGVYDG